MKNFYVLLFSAWGATAFSQTTLTKANNDYLVGNTISSKNLIGIPDNSATGLNATFDNSALTDGALITAQVSAPSPGELTAFPGTTVKFEDGNGNDVFYKSTVTQLEITGADVGGAVLNFSADNAVFLKFPTAFGDTYTDTARGSFSTGTVSGLFKGNITTTANASGTLLLGLQTFGNILRVKTVQNYNLYQSTDTNYLFAVGTLVSTFYTYYNNTNRYPIFTSTTTTISVPLLGINQTTSVAVAQNITTLGTNQNAAKKNIRVYPNPVSENLFFAGDLRGYEFVKVYTLDGKLVSSTVLDSGKIDMSRFPAGNYILNLSGTQQKAQNIQFIKK